MGKETVHANMHGNDTSMIARKEQTLRYISLRFVGLGNLGDLGSASTVDSVLGTRVIRIELLAHLEHFIGKGIQIHHLAREPWSGVGQVYKIKDGES